MKKTDFDDKLRCLNQKKKKKKETQIKQNIYLLKMDLKNLKTFDSSYFSGKSHFEEDNLLFQPM